MPKTNSITSIKQLVRTLNEIENHDDYKKVVKRLEIPLQEYEKYAFFSPDDYSRNCIARTEDYELLLLCWDAAQETQIHCHNKQECWVYVVQGAFLEERYVESQDGKELIDLKDRLQLKENEISYMNDEMGYHMLANANEKGRSISLHLYMNPIDECKVYNSESGEFEIKKLEYDSYEGKLLEKVEKS